MTPDTAHEKDVELRHAATIPGMRDHPGNEWIMGQTSRARGARAGPSRGLLTHRAACTTTPRGRWRHRDRRQRLTTHTVHERMRAWAERTTLEDSHFGSHLDRSRYGHRGMVPTIKSRGARMGEPTADA